MKAVSFKNSWILILLLCAIVFSWSLHRDTLAERQFAGDLRNRVVGARMQKDGLSPYFYKWKKGDGLRYYDPNNFDSVRVSNITGSPFFHLLLYPIADLPQRIISVCWLVAEYGMFLLIVLLSLSLMKTSRQQWLVLVISCLFLLTEAWKLHTANGQNYICIPFLALVFYCCLNKSRSLLFLLLAGICAAGFVLIRPNAVLFFIPFLFLLKRYGKVQVLLLLLPLVVAGLWIATSNFQKFLWKEYRENVTAQIKLHQDDSPAYQVNEPDPLFPNWEGIDRSEIQREALLHPQHVFSENGNFFIFSRLVLHKNPGTRLLTILFCGAAFVLLVVFYMRHRPGGFTLYNTALAGFCLLMLSDLFSPVYRHQYYAVQWMFPVFLSAAFYQPAARNIYLLLLAGLVLNVLNIPFMPMEHTIGEYIMLVAFIVLSLRRETETIQ